MSVDISPRESTEMAGEHRMSSGNLAALMHILGAGPKASVKARTEEGRLPEAILNFTRPVGNIMFREDSEDGKILEQQARFSKGL